MKTLIYIISSPRSGSTLLANILGNTTSFFNVGELNAINGFINENSRQANAFNNKCSCDEAFRHCAFWRDILALTASKMGISVKKISTFIKLESKSPFRILFKKKHLLDIKSNILANKSSENAACHAFSIFDNIVNKTGCSAIVDSSKKLTNLIAYNEYAPKDWQIKVIHIYRDPEGTATSVQKAGCRLGLKEDQNYFINLLKCIHYNSIIKEYLKGQDHMSVSLNELCQYFLAFEKKILKFISLPTFSKLSLVSNESQA